VNRALACVALVACAAADSPPPPPLAHEAIAITWGYQPELDMLAARVRRLKRELRGNLPGWETMIRIAQMANDQLGLESFEQQVPPGPGYHASPATLVGMGPYVRKRALELAAHGSDAELRFLIADEARRYAVGSAQVDGELCEVEAWLAAHR